MKLTFSANTKNLKAFAKLSGRLADGAWKREAHKGVIDAGRRVKTQVQRETFKQAAYRPGSYTKNVASETRQRNDEASLSTAIFGVKGGLKIDEYRGLKVLRGSKTLTSGTIRSGVWQNPRVFDRSFATPSGYFATLPSGGQSTTAPMAFWTFGNKPNQPRDAGGRFGSTGKTYGPVRRLAGPSLRKELVQGESARVFHREAPVQLSEKVNKRLEKIMRF
ncbi:hypothetical protein SAMN06297251_103115 [Fulvimarina manganoxydans]|uniref:Uncharacterized protein n=1 Tax=Fulvimarina manganoxydans TaxID=937218 RepID=A0A1W1ZTC8_9HYPH|nr:hypothetical protein [Fulvimarina manganoxydans]SMC51637.1 hypothetical protein SAMN06297251_103115 [Fulvimarina manganoxydans]